MKTRTRALPVVNAAMIVVIGALVSFPARGADVDNGRAVFAARCAVCHGATGQPDPAGAVVQGLGITPADLSDPLFNSREPGYDWEMVVKYGGEQLGLATQMPAHETSLTDDEVHDVIAYIKSMVDTRGYPPGEMNLFLPIRTRKAFPEDEIVYAGRYTQQDGDDAYKNVLEIEKRLGKAGQLILELIHEAEGDVSELSEAEIGYKQALSYSPKHILSGAAVVALPVEAEGDGELQTYFAYGRFLSDRWVFQSSLRFKFPFEDFSDGETELAAVVHYRHTPWPRSVFPALEVVATRPYRSANGDVEWTAMPQFRFGLTRGGHVALNLGVEIPLSDQDWDRRVYTTLLWDFADGSFFKGW